jgi:superfamily II DNA or RNA helicase
MLRPYQQQALDAVFREWQSARSTVLIMATGTGKTATASAILAERAKTGRILWLAHRTELLNQAAQTIRGRMGLEVEFEQAERHASWSGGLFGAQVVVASVQTLHRDRLSNWPRGAFDTIIVDEAHHATAKQYRDILDHFHGARVLGLTATPDRADGVALGTVFDSVASVYDIRLAIKEKWLVPIRQSPIFVGDLDLSTVRAVRGELNQRDLAAKMEAESVIHQIVAPTVELVGKRPTIMFTASVAQAEAVAAVARGYGIEAEAISGKTPPDERAAILDAYQAGDVTLLANCNVLTEGFDAPHTEVIAVARPTKSRALYAQMIGRGTRLSPGKTHCLVVDFVGNAGKHRLVCPADVLAGKELPEEVRRKVAEKADSGEVDIDAMLDLAQAEVAAEQAKREEEALTAKVKYEVGEAINPWTAEPVTDKQAAKLRQLGVPDHEVPETMGDAGKMLGEITERLKRGGPSFKQARILAKHGLRVDMKRWEAAFAIDAIAENDWKCPAEVLDAYGRRD